MAADFNLENKFISQSFEQLMQISGSIPVDGTGSAIASLTVTASNATVSISASHASTADQVNGTVPSASFATTASYVKNAVSASFVSNTVSASFAQTASLLLGAVVSSSFASNAATADLADSASFVTASNVVGTVTNATSASLAEEASQNFDSVSYNNSTFALEMTRTNGGTQSVTLTSGSYAISASAAITARSAHDADDLVMSVKNDSGGTLAIGTPVFTTGVQGDQLLVRAASASDNTKMPAIGILQQELTANAGGNAVVAGRLIGLDTSGLTAGNNVYVGADGGFVEEKPTGSNLIQNIGIIGKVNASEGEIVVIGAGRSNDVPNLATGQVLVGNNDQVATAVNTASLAVSSSVFATTASFLPSTTRLNITDITASNASFTSASVGYLESITGSAKIIGDAFIILNSDTPAERYAGVKVEDSGSASTASLQFDSQLNDWFYEYEGDATDHGVVLFGPEYGTIGNPTYNTNNRLVKGDGGHHINDSSITDDGTLVSTDSPISSSGGFTGSLHGNADTATTATTASYVTLAQTASFVTTAQTASYVETAQTASFVTTAQTASYVETAQTASFVTGSDVAGTVSNATSASYAPTNVSDDHTFTGTNEFDGQVHGGVTPLSIASTTASMDFQDGNFFTLTLSNGSDTHLDATNVTAGQTITLVVTNNATSAGTLSFSPDFEFAGGTAPTVTANTSAVDVLTFVTVDSTNVYGTSLLNFS